MGDDLAFIGLCRDCGARLAMEGDRRCGRCRSPRLLYHPELPILTIAHIDCDAFYAAIEKRDNPALRDHPVIIGGGRRGVVSTACYIARMKGVRSAMPMFQARKLCPEAIVLPPAMEKYRRAGSALRTMMLELTPALEPLSIDEAFLDLSGTETLHKRSAAESLLFFAQRVEKELGISVSVGLSYNKFLAKIASDLQKPRGYSVIGRTEVKSFLADRPISLIWGIGKTSAAKLARDGLHRIWQLQQMDRQELIKKYGNAMGEHLYSLSRGDDPRAVDSHSETKSVSSETTFDEDISDPTMLLQELWQLCETVSRRLKKSRLAGSVVHLKLKTSAFRLISRQTSLRGSTQLADTIYRAASILLEREAKGERYRLIGVGVSILHEYADDRDADLGNMDLGDPLSLKRSKIERTMDKIREKLGPKSITKGIGFEKPNPSRRK